MRLDVPGRPQRHGRREAGGRRGVGEPDVVARPLLLAQPVWAVGQHDRRDKSLDRLGVPEVTPAQQPDPVGEWQVGDDRLGPFAWGPGRVEGGGHGDFWAASGDPPTQSLSLAACRASGSFAGRHPALRGGQRCGNRAQDQAQDQRSSDRQQCHPVSDVVGRAFPARAVRRGRPGTRWRTRPKTRAAERAGSSDAALMPTGKPSAAPNPHSTIATTAIGSDGARANTTRPTRASPAHSRSTGTRRTGRAGGCRRSAWRSSRPRRSRRQSLRLRRRW